MKFQSSITHKLIFKEQLQTLYDPVDLKRSAATSARGVRPPSVARVSSVKTSHGSEGPVAVSRRVCNARVQGYM